MPGMMDTILNLSLNDEIYDGLSKNTKNSRFAGDTYRRFLQIYGNVAQGLCNEKYESVLSKFKKEHDYTSDLEMKAEDWSEIIDAFKTSSSHRWIPGYNLNSQFGQFFPHGIIPGPNAIEVSMTFRTTWELM